MLSLDGGDEILLTLLVGRRPREERAQKSEKKSLEDTIEKQDLNSKDGAMMWKFSKRIAINAFSGCPVKKKLTVTHSFESPWDVQMELLLLLLLLF